MASKWPTKPVGEVCDHVIDCVNKTAVTVPYPTPYKMVRTTNIRDGRIDLSECRFVEEDVYKRWTRRSDVRGGDVLLTREAPIGEVGYFHGNEKIFLGQRVMQYRTNPKIMSSRFLFYAFRSPSLQHQFRSHEGSGSVVSHIRVGDCSLFRVPVPPLLTQNAIANILGTLDDKIDLLRSMNETLEAMARALFKSWFIDFDPVRKKAEGQPTGLPPEIDALFPDSFEDSELGEIPKGWKVLPFLSQIELIGGGTPKTSMKEYWEGDIPWYSVVDSPRPQDIFVIDTEKHITQEAIDNSSTRILPAGTTIISARGTVGNLALTATPMCMNQSCYGVRSTIPSGDTYTYFALKNIVQSLKGMAHGSVFDTITRSTFDSATACVPSPSLIQAYGEKTAPILSQVRCNLYEIKSLTLGRDTLLPRLISGDLELSDKDITKIMEPAK